MAHPEIFSESEPPQRPEGQLSEQDLIDLAADMTDNKSSDFFASFTSFLNVGMSHDKALEMLGINPEEARRKLDALRDKQAESLRQNVESIREFGGSIINAAAMLNPLRYLKRK